jgi:hypothetical protein
MTTKQGNGLSGYYRLSRRCFFISETEPGGVSGKRDAKCCLCSVKVLICRLYLGISETELGVPGQRDTVAVVAGYKSRLCFACT